MERQSGLLDSEFHIPVASANLGQANGQEDRQCSVGFLNYFSFTIQLGNDGSVLFFLPHPPSPNCQVPSMEGYYPADLFPWLLNRQVGRNSMTQYSSIILASAK